MINLLVPAFGEIASEAVRAEAEPAITLTVAQVQGKVTVLRAGADYPGSRDSQILTGGETFTRTFECSTGELGQAVLKLSSGLEIRMKEDCLLSWDGQSTFSVSQGQVGFRLPGTASSGFLLLCPQLTAESLAPATLVVIKAGTILTRVGVLKGKARVTGPVGYPDLILQPRQEAAAGEAELSRPYGCLDDLYFAWYWDKPAF